MHGPALAHKAMEEGVIAVEHAAGLDPHPLDYERHPGRDVLLAERRAASGSPRQQAKDAGHDVVVGKVPYGVAGATHRLRRPHRHGQDRRRQALRRDPRRATIVGSKADDMMQELVNAKLLEGGYPELARMIHGHPTFSEAVLEAARAADGWLIHG